MSQATMSQENGYFLSLDRAQAKTLFAQRGEAAISACIDGWIDARGTDGSGLLPCRELWDPLDRILAEVSSRPETNAPILAQCVRGGRSLATQRAIQLIRPDLVPHLAAALKDLPRENCRDRYFELKCGEDEGDGDDQQWQELAGLIDRLQAFYEQSAAKGQAVVFATRPE